MLKTDYKNFIPDGNGRKYSLTQDGQGYTKINDETTYIERGDNFGANDMNATNSSVNGLHTIANIVIPTTDWEQLQDEDETTYYAQTFTVIGLKSTDVPVVAIALPDGVSINVLKTIQTEYQKFLWYECDENRITFAISEVPQVEFNIEIKEVGA